MTTVTGEHPDGTVARWTHPLVIVLVPGPLVCCFGVAVAWTGTGGSLAAWWPGAAPATAAVALAAAGASWRRPAPRPLLMLSVLAGVGVGSLVARLVAGRYPQLAVGWALADVAQAVVAGLVLASGAGLRLCSGRDVLRLTAAAVAGASVAGGIAVVVGTPRLAGHPVMLFTEVAASRVSAVLLLVPLLMCLPRRLTRPAPVEAVLLWLLVLAAIALVLVVPGGLPLAFLPAAALVGAALRQSPRATVLQLVIVGVLFAAAAAARVGPFARPGEQPVGVLVQTFLAVGAVTVLTVMLIVTARDSALQASADLRRFDLAVLESVAAGVLACDADGRVVVRNAASRWSAPGAGTADAGDDLTPYERDLIRRALSGEEVRGAPAPAAAQEPRDLVADARPIHAPDGRLLGAVATFTDVTDERTVQGRLQDAVTFHDAVLAASPDVIFITDVATHRVVWASGTIEPTLGYTPSQIVELDRASRLNVVHPDDVDALHATDDAAARLRDGEVRTVRVRMSNDRGELRWMARRVTPFTRSADGRVVQLLGVARDVTDVVEVERRLTDAANRDPLTGLLNRRALLDRLAAVVLRARSGESAPTPVLFCDLDGFKAVNDSLGHVAGDELLTTVAHRIVSSLREGDTPARAGGDEFVLLLEPRTARPAETRAEVLARARTVAHRILEAVSRPVEVQGTRLTVTISIGIALVRPGIGPDEVLRDADAAMYRAKSTGKNRLHVFEVAPERRRPDPA